jgi:hypothetical protein
MYEIEFRVQGSEAEPYRVTFIKQTETELFAYCTCLAGSNGQYCKHRFGILAGDTKGIVSENVSEVHTVQSWLSGTSLERALLAVQTLELEEAKIKKELSSAKKEIAKVMRG